MFTVRLPLRSVSITLLGTVVAASFAVFLWSRLYPEPYDPKNPGYVLWKRGMNRHMDLDAATAGMTHDAWAVNIVKGMTKDELKSRLDTSALFKKRGHIYNSAHP